MTEEVEVAKRQANHFLGTGDLRRVQKEEAALEDLVRALRKLQ